MKLAGIECVWTKAVQRVYRLGPRKEKVYVRTHGHSVNFNVTKINHPVFKGTVQGYSAAFAPYWTCIDPGNLSYDFYRYVIHRMTVVHIFALIDKLAGTNRLSDDDITGLFRGELMSDH